MEQAVLTDAQRRVLVFAGKDEQFAPFYLTGGTALAAFYLQHRVSDDLDFFTEEDVDAMWIRGKMAALAETLDAQGVRYERLHDRHQFFFDIPKGDLKVEFTRYPFQQLEKAEMQDGVRVDSARDIAANKVMTICDRFDPKDFVDLYFLLQQRSLSDIRGDVQIKFKTTLDDVFLGGELAKVRRITALPRMIKPLTIDELRAFFTERAKELAGNVLE